MFLLFDDIAQKRGMTLHFLQKNIVEKYFRKTLQKREMTLHFSQKNIVEKYFRKTLQKREMTFHFSQKNISKKTLKKREMTLHFSDKKTSLEGLLSLIPNICFLSLSQLQNQQLLQKLNQLCKYSETLNWKCILNLNVFMFSVANI